MSNNNAFNGSVVSFPSTGAAIGGLRGISFDESAAEVSVTSSTHTTQKFVAGIPKKEVTVDVVGGTALTATSTGTEGTLGITWNNTATVGALTDAVLTSVSINGQMDGEISATLKFASASTS